MSILFYYVIYCIVSILVMCYFIDKFQYDDETNFEIVLFGIICFTNVVCIVILILGMIFEGIYSLFKGKKNSKMIKSKLEEQKRKSIESYIKQCRGKK